MNGNETPLWQDRILLNTTKMSSKDLVQSYEAQLTAQNNNSIATPEALAAYRRDDTIPHYRDLEQNLRFQWLGQQIVKLNQVLHKETVEDFLQTDVVMLDENIMDDIHLSDFTLAEIDEAFSRGICGAYGPYYGLNPPSLMGFLRAFLETPKKKEALKINNELMKQERRAQLDKEIRKQVAKRKKKEKDAQVV